MDVTFVLEESGVTATVEVPCEADVAAAKEVACTAFAVSPASVEMRIGTKVLEGTCRLQDTAFDSGVQVVLARPRFADIKCPAEYTDCAEYFQSDLSLSCCGTLCVFQKWTGQFGGFDTETFKTVFSFATEHDACGPPAISRCKTRCYVPCRNHFREVALPGGEVLRKVDGNCTSVFACGGVVVSKGKYGVSVYDEDLTLLRSLSHEMCGKAAVSDCGGWVITSSDKERNVRLWDVNTGEAVACVPAGWRCEGVALSQSASVFAVGYSDLRGRSVQLYDWSGAALGSIAVDGGRIVGGIQFTPCGTYVVVQMDVREPTGDSTDGDVDDDDAAYGVHQYDVATMSCVHVIQEDCGSFEISPCSRVVVATRDWGSSIITRHLYPHNSE